jgi:hypothetical protein
MAKANDKAVVREAKRTLTAALSNLLESHRERKFRAANGLPQSRKAFCAAKGLKEGTVAHIETGRFLGLKTSQLRQYLAVTHKQGSAKFAQSVKTVTDGLKELDNLLSKL